ncbi:hypothetical protein M758_UG208000 [Ceratodon purpureus]|nr:hypothetical protein M758_UG208000 [Ceratodon purpureus]
MHAARISRPLDKPGRPPKPRRCSSQPAVPRPPCGSLRNHQQALSPCFSVAAFTKPNKRTIPNKETHNQDHRMPSMLHSLGAISRPAARTTVPEVQQLLTIFLADQLFIKKSPSQLQLQPAVRSSILGSNYLRLALTTTSEQDTATLRNSQQTTHREQLDAQQVRPFSQNLYRLLDHHRALPLHSSSPAATPRQATADQR